MRTLLQLLCRPLLHVAGLLALCIGGAGPWSLDRWLATRRKKKGGD